MPQSIISIIFSIGIALLSFGAFYWPESLGMLAASPGVLFLLIAIFFAPFFLPKRLILFRKLRFNYLLIAPIIGSIFSLIIFGWDFIYASKFFSLGLLWVVWLSPLLLIDFLQPKHIRVAALLGILFCLVGYLVSDLLGILPEAIRSMVFGGGYYDSVDLRPRGFSEESSHFSVTVAQFFIIYFLIKESYKPYRGIRLILFFALLALFLAVLGSKGAAFGVAFAMLSLGFSRHHKLLYLIVIFPGILWLIATQLNAVSTDIELYSSTATRIVLFLTGIMSSISNPIGWGYYGFYGAIQNFGGFMLGLFATQAPMLPLFEAQNIIEQLRNVSTKSTALDFVMVFGWLSFLPMVKVIRSVRMNDPRVRACLVFIITSAMFTSGHQSILTFLAIAIILMLYPSSPIVNPSALASHRKAGRNYDSSSKGDTPSL